MAIRIKFDPESEGYDVRAGKRLSRLHPLTIKKPKSYQGDVLHTKSHQAWVWHPEIKGYRKHSASKDPKTGMVLKGRKHPTWSKIRANKPGSGFKIVKRDGRYYEVKKQPTTGQAAREMLNK